MIELVKEIDQNDALYKEYLSQPYLKDNMETDFCKEENILARYAEIFDCRKKFISPLKKKLQRNLYYPIKLEKKAARLVRIVKAYGKKAIAMLKVAS